ncbi:MAG: hypothetical protein F4Y44_09280 [Chloroflexi bacterium]|nr:hypothetical protein [Chloroflexota bacterium]
MEQQPTPTFRRSPFEILGESFSIYGKHFRNFILIALLVQVPMSIFGLAMAGSLPTEEDFTALVVRFVPDADTAILGEGSDISELPDPISNSEIIDFLVSLTVLTIVTLAGQTLLSGVIAVAVALQYTTGRFDVGACYRRAWWRILTLVVLALVFFGLLALLLIGLTILILPGIVVMVLMIYLAVDIPAATIEGYKPIAALKRSYELVRNNWWRTFAAVMLVFLVIVGISIVLGLVLGIPLTMLVGEDASELAFNVTTAVVGLVTNTLIAPIAGITSALIYLNLRSRKEDLDERTLAIQMGIIAPDMPDESYSGPA